MLRPSCTDATARCSTVDVFPTPPFALMDRDSVHDVSFVLYALSGHSEHTAIIVATAYGAKIPLGPFRPRGKRGLQLTGNPFAYLRAWKGRDDARPTTRYSRKNHRTRNANGSKPWRRIRRCNRSPRLRARADRSAVHSRPHPTRRGCNTASRPWPRSRERDEQRTRNRENATHNKAGAKEHRRPRQESETDGAQQLVPVPAQWDDRHHSVLAKSLANRAGGLRPLVRVRSDVRQLPLGMEVETDRIQTEPMPAILPGIEPVQPSPVPVLPFVAMFDRAGGTSMTRGRGAALGMRLYVETLLALPPELRRTTGPPVILTCTLRQLVGALWPRGWQRGRDWPRLMAGLDAMHNLGVEWEAPDGSGGVRLVVAVRDRPRDRALLDDVCRFEVLLPPGSSSGPLVDRHHLRLLGLDSAPAFRLYLALCWLWDVHGTFQGRLIGTTMPEAKVDPAGYILDAHGRHITERDGSASRRPTHKRAVRSGKRSINQAALTAYPPLSPDDLAVMAYAPADLADSGARRRDQRRVARKALNLITELTRAVVRPVRRQDGVGGCVQVLPPSTHKAAHDAAFQVRQPAPS